MAALCNRQQPPAYLFQARHPSRGAGADTEEMRAATPRPSGRGALRALWVLCVALAVPGVSTGAAAPRTTGGGWGLRAAFAPGFGVPTQRLRVLETRGRRAACRRGAAPHHRLAASGGAGGGGGGGADPDFEAWYARTKRGAGGGVHVDGDLVQYRGRCWRIVGQGHQVYMCMQQVRVRCRRPRPARTRAGVAPGPPR